MIVAIYADYEIDKIAEAATDLISAITKETTHKAVKVTRQELNSNKKIDWASIDLILSLGGDGAVLGLARALNGAPTVVVGVNFGKLGFLTAFTYSDITEDIDKFLSEQSWKNIKPIMLRAQIKREGQLIASDIALNEVVVARGTTAGMVLLDCSVDDRFMTSYYADGLIISTPVGSTAYNLAANGPILHQSMKAIALLPQFVHIALQHVP